MALQIKNTLGGGGGGFYPSVFIMELEQTDAVSITGQGKTYTPIWTIINNVSGWYFAKIEEFGTYEITATNGTDTTTETISIDSAIEYDISMGYGITRPTNTSVLLHLNGELIDSVGNSSPQWNGTAQYTKGKFGECALYDGSSSISIPMCDAINFGSNDFTMAAWFYITGGVDGWYNFFCQNWYYSSSYKYTGFYFRYRDDTNQFELEIKNSYSDPSGYGVKNSGTLPLNKWTHIAATKKGTTAYIFVNGELLGSGPLSSYVTPSSKIYQHPSSHLQVGASNSETTASCTPFRQLADGSKVDEVIIVNGSALWTASFEVPSRPYK